MTLFVHNSIEVKRLERKNFNISAIKHTAKKYLRNKPLMISVTAVILIIAAAAVIFSIDSVKYSLRDKINFYFPDKLPYYIYYENNVPHYDINEVDFEKNDVREVQVGNNRKYLINHS